MKILVLGGGLMGPAAAYTAMIDPAVASVTIADRSSAQLDNCASVLHNKLGASKLTFTQLNLNDLDLASHLMADFDAAVAALPTPVNILAIDAALQANLPLVDLAQTPLHIQNQMREQITEPGRFIILGCGVEPGLTEIVARYLAEKMDRVDELHIKCGGIPQNPAPPLGYKIVFGGRQMPLHTQDAEVVRNGQIELVPRYSGIEPVDFATVGECEAWHEGFKPWILDIPALRSIKTGTQKTVRWPGYAEKITTLKDLGLLSLDPVQVNGVPIVPKHLVDAVLYPKVKLEEGEQDITCFRVELIGEKDGRPCLHKAEMVDRYDKETGLTSMARTTAFTGAVVARMIAAGQLEVGSKPIVTPEKVIFGPLCDLLLAELRAMGVDVKITQTWI